MNEVTFTLKFSDEDFNTLDYVARVLKISRDALLKEMLAEGISGCVRETLTQFRALIEEVQDRNLARIAGVPVSDAKRVRTIMNSIFGRRA